MKKKSLLSLMLLCFACFGVARAQSELTVHNGTGTSDFVPAYGYYADAYLKCEMVYPAAELEEMAGGSISGMTFYATSPAAEAWTSTWQVFITEVTGATISAFAGPGTIVYQGTLNGTQSQMTIDFDTPYVYGGGNLLVGVYNISTGNYKAITWAGETVTGASVQGYSYSSLNAINPTQRNFLPKTTFTYIPSGSTICDKPDYLYWSELSSVSALLHWADNNFGEAYNLEYKKATDEAWTTVFDNESIISYQLTGLTPNTSYQARVRTVCQDGTTSGWRNENFTTYLGIPSFESFDSSSIPNDWTMYTGLIDTINLDYGGLGTPTTYGWTFGTGNGVFDSHARANIYGSSCSRWLVSPTIDPENHSNGTVPDVQLSFDVAYTAFYGTDAPAQTGTDDKFVVMVLVAGESWEILRQWDNAGSEYVLNDLTPTPTTVTINLGVYSGYYNNVAFYVESTVDNADNNLHIDNVAIEYVPACPAPTGVTINNTSAHGCEVTFTPGDETQTQWCWAFTTTNQAPTDYAGLTTINEGLIIETANILPETSYYLWIGYICPEDGQIYWSRPAQFTTSVACPAPTDLTVYDVTSTSATLSWTSEAESWVIRLENEDDEFVDIEVSTNPYTLNDLTPETLYSASVEAVCGGEDGTSQWSSPVSFEPTNKTVIGSGSETTTNSFIPTYTFYNYSFNQQIYTVEELGEAGIIESIDFYCTNAPSTSIRAIDIYMVSTDKDSFESSTDWITVTENDKVYSGSYFFTTGWNSFVFDTPFFYDGAHNVALIIDDNTGSYNSYNDFRVFNAPAQTLRIYSDYTDYDPTNPSSYAGTTMDVKNQIRILKNVLSDCMKPMYLTVTEVGPDYAVLDWTEYGTSEEWVVSYIWTAQNARVEVTATEHPFTLTGLEYDMYHNVQVRPACDENLWSDLITFYTLTECPAPTDLTDIEVGIDYAVVDWVEHGYAESWYIFINTDYDPLPPFEVTEHPYTINNLWPESTYSIMVMPACGVIIDDEGLVDVGDETSESDWLVFTTLDDCPPPTDLEVTNLLHNSATVSWSGTSEDYYVEYWWTELVPASTFDFEDGMIPTDWNNIGSQFPWEMAYDELENSYYMRSSNQGIANSESIISFTASFNNWTYISFDAKCMGEGSGDYIYDSCSFYIDNVLKFVKGANGDSWETYLSNDFIGTHTFTWKYTKDVSVNPTGDYFGVDNIVLYSSDFHMGTTIEELADTTYTFTGLTPYTIYEVNVVPSCDPDAGVSIEFQTPSLNHKIFFAEGNWNTANSWSPAGVPTLSEEVELYANATIPSGCVAEAKKITFTGTPTPTLTIADGGQLLVNQNVTATVKKNITGYGTENTYSNKGYYLLTTPLLNGNTAASAGLITTEDESTYDLYSWSRTSQDAEWQNFKQSSFYLLNGTGYLYANLNDVELSFTGTIRANHESYTMYPYYSEEHGGWNAFGNPFMCEAYVCDIQGVWMPYYRLIDSTLVAVANAIPLAPMEGFFINANTSGQDAAFTVSKDFVAKSNGLLNMTLNQDDSQKDNIIIRFGEGNTLRKLNFFENRSKLFIAMEGQDYAVVNADKSGEMPVSFKAEEDGTFTLRFYSEDITFSYLRLVDTQTNTEVDLLAQPEYTFSAKAGEDSSRFIIIYEVK